MTSDAEEKVPTGAELTLFQAVGRRKPNLRRDVARKSPEIRLRG
jgi:hypothetical protein